MFVLPVSAELWDGFLLGISILSYISVLSSGYPLFCQNTAKSFPCRLEKQGKRHRSCSPVTMLGCERPQSDQQLLRGCQAGNSPRPLAIWGNHRTFDGGFDGGFSSTPCLFTRGRCYKFWRLKTQDTVLSFGVPLKKNHRPTTHAFYWMAPNVSNSMPKGPWVSYGFLILCHSEHLATHHICLITKIQP